jgi:hypothetical protein
MYIFSKQIFIYQNLNINNYLEKEIWLRYYYAVIRASYNTCSKLVRRIPHFSEQNPNNTRTTLEQCSNNVRTNLLKNREMSGC